jgi:hypothetical protein
VTQRALLDVRVLPWRLRARKPDPDELRRANPLSGADDLEGLVIGIVLWLLIIVAAPLLALLIAAMLFTIELPVVLALALLLVVIRFAGIVPWTVVVHDVVTGEETRERHRALWRALARIREVNGDRRVEVRWAWA